MTKIEVLLNSEDIETLIKSFYKNVESITFSIPDVKITLKISGLKPIQQIVKSNEPEKSVEPVKQLTPEQKMEEEAKAGLMVGGGAKRSMVNIG